MKKEFISLNEFVNLRLFPTAKSLPTLRKIVTADFNGNNVLGSKILTADKTKTRYFIPVENIDKFIKAYLNNDIKI